MDPHTVFCPNLDCPARGQTGQGNITIHSQAEARYRCTVCRKTFSARRGTPFYRTQYDEELITLVVTLIAHGGPAAAAVVAFGLHPRTIQHWVTAAGEHAARVQQQLVAQPRDLDQVQADEIRVKAQGGVWWMALAIQVQTRLWLGGVVGAQRDRALIRQIADLVARCASVAPLLLVSDGLMSYVGAFQRACRTRVPRPGKRAAWVPWPEVAIGQVVKQYARCRVVGIERRVVQGAAMTVAALLERTQGGGVLNTSFIERLNGTFRSRLARLGRRTRHGAVPGGIARTDVSGGHGVQLLHAACEFANRRGAPPHAGDGGGDHRGMLDSGALAALPGASRTMGAPQATRAQIETNPRTDPEVGGMTTAECRPTLLTSREISTR
jgi:transposase-like protein